MEKYFRKLTDEQLLNLYSYFKEGREILCGSKCNLFVEDNHLWPAAAANTREVFAKNITISCGSDALEHGLSIKYDKWLDTLHYQFSSDGDFWHYLDVLRSSNNEDIVRAVNVVLTERKILHI